MSWPARTWIDGELVTASLGNEYWRDPLTDLRGGGIAIASQGSNDFLYATGASQWGRLSATSGRVPKFNGSAWEMAVVDGGSFHPVGTILEFAVSTNPNGLLGYGTWVAFGTGRVTVGIDAGDSDFNTVEETGGAKTHQLTIAEMPSHGHIQNAHNHTQDPHDHTLSNLGNSIDVSILDEDISVVDNSGTKTTSSVTATNNPATATNQNAGGDGAHNNVQPYIVVYRWKRTE